MFDFLQLRDECILFLKKNTNKHMLAKLDDADLERLFYYLADCQVYKIHPDQKFGGDYHDVIRGFLLGRGNKMKSLNEVMIEMLEGWLKEPLSDKTKSATEQMLKTLKEKEG